MQYDPNLRRQLMKQTVYLTLILLVVAGLFFAVGDSMAKPSGQQSSQSAETSWPSGISAISPDAIRSGVIYWDYRVGIPAQPETILTVSADKIFVLTDLVFTPMAHPASCDNPVDIKIYEDTTLKTIIYCPKDQIHFSSGILFAPGSHVNISQPAVGGTLLGNITLGVTVSGYEYAP
jgi:hypothetical protein